MKLKQLLSFCGLCSCFLIGCDTGSYSLRKIEIPAGAHIDTIESYPELKIHLLGVSDYKGIDNENYFYAFCKELKDKPHLVYEFIDQGKWPRVSKDLIALVKEYPNSQVGWFNLKEGQIQGELPRMSLIVDSLKSSNNNVLHITEKNGYILFYLNGKIVKSLNYGNLVTNYKNLNFDSLDYKIYKIQHDTLKIASENGNNLFDQDDGIYFIPPPGFGTIRQFDKKQILALLDSVSKFPEFPRRVSIKPIY